MVQNKKRILTLCRSSPALTDDVRGQPPPALKVNKYHEYPASVGRTSVGERDRYEGFITRHQPWASTFLKGTMHEFKPIYTNC